MDINLKVSSNVYTWLSVAVIGVMGWALLSQSTPEAGVKEDVKTLRTEMNAGFKTISDRLGHKPGSPAGSAP